MEQTDPAFLKTSLTPASDHLIPHFVLSSINCMYTTSSWASNCPLWLLGLLDSLSDSYHELNSTIACCTPQSITWHLTPETISLYLASDTPRNWWVCHTLRACGTCVLRYSSSQQTLSESTREAPEPDYLPSRESIVLVEDCHCPSLTLLSPTKHLPAL